MGANDLFIRFYRTAARRREARHDDAMTQWDNGTTCSRRHLRPDGYGICQHDGTQHGFFLEFDCGTMRRHGYLDKFDEYYDYAISQRSKRDYRGYPTILIVTVNNRNEEKIRRWHGWRRSGMASSCPMLLICLWRIEGPADSDGMLCSIWREPDDDFGDRRRWIENGGR
jgi:hypothetical protein